MARHNYESFDADVTMFIAMSATNTRTVADSVRAPAEGPNVEAALLIQAAGQPLCLLASQVEQVRAAVQVTPLPGAPGLIEGVVRLGAEIVPVLDGRRRLGIAHRDVATADHFVIVRARGKKLAIHVDSAGGLVQVPRADIEAAVSLRMSVFGCAGIARLKGGMFLVHDTDALLSPHENARLLTALAPLQSPGYAA